MRNVKGILGLLTIVALPSASSGAEAQAVRTALEPRSGVAVLLQRQPCLTRLRDFGPSVDFILMGNRSDGGDASFARGTLARAGDLVSGAEFEATDVDWLLANRTRCENPSYIPGGFGSCGSLQPFSTDEASHLEIAVSENGLVTLEEPSWPWHASFMGKCEGNVLYGSSGADFWTLTFSRPPPGPR